MRALRLGHGVRTTENMGLVGAADVEEDGRDEALYLADGSLLLDPTYDPWAPMAAKYPAFGTERQKQMARTIRSPDGTPHPVHKLILAEARDPSGEGNKQATPRVVELAAERPCALQLVTQQHERRGDRVEPQPDRSGDATGAAGDGVPPEPERSSIITSKDTSAVVLRSRAAEFFFFVAIPIPG